MADQPKQTPNIHALLIGIDYYKPNRLYKSLKGCVRDINLVDGYLRRTLFGSNLIANQYTVVVIEVDASQKQVKLPMFRHP